MTKKIVPLHEVERLIKQLDNPIRSAKIRAASQLENIPVYPSLISSPEQFINDVLLPVLHHISNETESVRESCVKIIQSYIKQLGTNFIHQIFQIIFPKLVSRLESEDIEPAEQIRLSLLKLIWEIIKMVPKDSQEISLNDYTEMLSSPLTVSFKATDAKMKKTGCYVLNSLMEVTSPESLQQVSVTLINSIIPNCLHKHYEVRKLSVSSLSVLYAKTGEIESIDKLKDILQFLTDDTNSEVRKGVIEFCVNLLVSHEHRHLLYYPLLLPILYFLRPLIPIPPNQISSSTTEEAILSYDSICKIAQQYEQDNSITSNETFQFDQNHFLSTGIIRIICDNFNKFMDLLLPMLTDWKETNRIYGFSSLISILYISHMNITNYIPQIFQRLYFSLRDMRGDQQNALDTASVASYDVNCDDIINIFLPKITNEGPKEIILLLIVIVRNSIISDEFLDNILTQCINSHIYECLECNDSLIQLTIAIIRKSKTYSTNNTSKLLHFILKLCESTNSLQLFENVFDESISIIFSQHIQTLLKMEDITPQYLSQLLLIAPIISVQENQELICNILIDTIKSTNSSNVKSELYELIIKLSKRKIFSNLNDDFIDVILEGMVWYPGKDKICFRENSTLSLSSIIKYNGINEETLKRNEEKILPMILSSMDDTWADEVRVAGMKAMLHFIKRIDFNANDFDKIYSAIRQRMDDNLLTIRILAVKIMAEYLPKCNNVNIDDKWNDLLIFIDDDSIEMRSEMEKLIRNCLRIESFKDSLKKNLKEQKNYHKEADEICEKLLMETENE